MNYSRTALVFAVCTLLGTSYAHAQATRTWVSGVGDDANPCSRTAPCKTFAGAISKTAAGGEISVLDPGGFGAVTITKSITINGEGVVASIIGTLVNGVNINDAATATPGTIFVTLRNLQINGAGSGLSGINFVSGAALVVENVLITGFQNGIKTAMGNTMVTNSTIVRNSLFGVRTTIAGSANFEGSTFANNGVAVQAGAGTTIRLSNNAIYNNSTGFGCGGGTLASAGDNRKGNNVGGVVPVCNPTDVVTLQ